MTTAVTKEVGKQIKTWHATVLDSMQTMNTMITNLQLAYPSHQQLTLMDEDEDDDSITPRTRWFTHEQNSSTKTKKKQ